VAVDGLPTLRVHDLRHTHATLLLAAGEHATVALTLDRYSHVTPDLQAAATARIAAALGG
jgi:integrase